MCAVVSLSCGSEAGAAGLPQNLPAALPPDLLLTPFDADFVWAERWGSNDAWGNAAMWRTGAQLDTAVGGDNSVLILNRGIYRETLQELPVPDGSPPDAAGARVWVGTAEPEGESGNDNIDVGGTFTLGELTVQNVSVGVGRSFRSGGVLVFDSGDPARNARIVHLGDESSGGDDMNIREATDIRLDSHTEMFLLNTGSRIRVRDQSRIFGTGDLILNPGDHIAYAGEATGQGSAIERELRVEDFGRIATEGRILINAARLRLMDFGDIANASEILVNPGGQLMLDRSGAVAYALGIGFLRINSEGHEMDGGDNGALRQQAGEPGDVASVVNPVEVIGDSRLHVRNAGSLVLTGDISGIGELRKTGEGTLRLEGLARNTGGWEITNGTVEVVRANGLPEGPLRFGSPENRRTLALSGDQTVTLLDGDAPDPDEPDAENTLVLNLAPESTLTVDQAKLSEGDAEDDTRFQGAITGGGGFTKTGDGILRFTRWPKAYTGPTTVDKGVLAVSESAALAQTDFIDIYAGGQLRLTSSGDGVRYRFGGPLSLAGEGRGGDITVGVERGILGALRYDPGGGEHTATLESEVVIPEDATIHVNGLDKTLILEGPLSGNGTLTRSGGGDLILRGENSLTGGTRIENGITRVQAGSSLGTGPLQFVDVDVSATVDLDNGGEQVVADLFGGSTEDALFVRSGTRLVIGGDGGSTAEPFRGVITGGGSIALRAGEWHCAGFLSGLSELLAESGMLRLSTGGSQIGELRVDSAAEAVLEGTFSSVPLSVDGRWTVEHAAEHGAVFTSTVSVSGEVRFAGSLDAAAPLRVDQNLVFAEGARISVPGAIVPAEGESVYSLASVGGSVQGLENVLVLAPAGAQGVLEMTDGVLSVRLSAEDGAPAELVDVMGSFAIAGDGTYESPWLGVFEAPGFSANVRWILPYEQTWWWAAPGASGGDAWFYDIALGWVWTGESVYPFVYADDFSAWMYYGLNTTDHRLFFLYDDEPGWIEAPFAPES
ncbi:MAG: autotransporter-associated beta strand repeat-containing protein [Opitutales bacterium]|nr:autotransporter-associated beta strand repeat-containing protein [Opitutales bacterium]